MQTYTFLVVNESLQLKNISELFNMAYFCTRCFYCTIDNY
jgi:hypothetical protein